MPCGGVVAVVCHAVVLWQWYAMWWCCGSGMACGSVVEVVCDSCISVVESAT